MVVEKKNLAAHEMPPEQRSCPTWASIVR
jgi:hypothetical protein